MMNEVTRALRLLRPVSALALLLCGLGAGYQGNHGGYIAAALGALALAGLFVEQKMGLSALARGVMHALVTLGWVYWWRTALVERGMPKYGTYFVLPLAVSLMGFVPFVAGESADGNTASTLTVVGESTCDQVMRQCPSLPPLAPPAEAEAEAVAEAATDDPPADYSSERPNDRGAPEGTTSSSSSVASSGGMTPTAPTRPGAVKSPSFA